MKHNSLLLATLTLCSVLAGPPEQPKPIKKEPPQVYVGAAPATSGETFVYGEQKPAAGRPVLVAPEQANNLIARFKAAYPQMGNPRIVLYVNRELVDEQTGLKLTGRTERSQFNATEVKNEFKADPNAPQPTAPASVPSASNVTIVGDVSGARNRVPGSENVNTRTEKTTHENTYKLNEKTAPSLADKQTVRDVERLFARPLRMAGANVADQKVASLLLADKPLKDLQGGSEQARRDREALKEVADVAIEILISSRNVTVTELSGDNTYTLPDIQATAVRLSDARILGQATATDIIGKDRYAGNIARNFDVREIAEATALALMEDMLLNTPQ
jgi:hypothetical protein